MDVHGYEWISTGIHEYIMDIQNPFRHQMARRLICEDFQPDQPNQSRNLCEFGSKQSCKLLVLWVIFMRFY